MLNRTDEYPARYLKMAIRLLPRMPSAMAHALGTIGVLLMVFANPVEASATEITPNDVGQVVGTINGELALLRDASGGTQNRIDEKSILTPRRPRHVLQKAREVMLKVQLLRKVNGLTVKGLPPIPNREVRPLDVKVMVDRVQQDLLELRPIFGVTGAPVSVPRPSDKTPTDVYRELSRASAQLDTLGIPKVVPNDVYRVALMIIKNLEEIGRSRGLTGPIALQDGGRNKQPADVYAMAMTLLGALKSLTSSNPDLAVPGGVELLEARLGRIEPAQVMDLLNNILAEVLAIKVRLDIASPFEFPPPQAGKTPSHVYGALSTALDIVETLS